MPAVVPIEPAKLLEAARDFATHHGGAGRPRPIWLRRAVSSAYYALFHCLGRQSAAHLMPRRTLQEQLRVARSFDHAALKETCEWIAGRRGHPPRHSKALIDSLRGTPIDDVAAAFCDLQEARHRADYDHLTPFSKAVVLGHIQDAEKAIQQLTAAPARDRQAFFTLLSLRTGLR